MSDDRGQATIDYVALLAVLALVLGSAAAFTGVPAAGVADAVLGQLRRALCIVTGGACLADRPPCVLASDGEAHRVTVSAVIVRVDGERYVLRERLSDGTVRLTLAHRGALGVEAALGGSLRLKLRGRKIDVAREASAGGQVVAGYGEVYVAHDKREADEIMRAIARAGLRLGRSGVPAREVFAEAGSRGLARVALGGLSAGASLEGFQDRLLGARRDTQTGALTLTLSVGGMGWALLNAALSGPVEAHDGEVAIDLTLDRDRSPIALGLRATGTLSAGAALPPGLAGLARGGDVLARGEDGAMIRTSGRRWELAANLDLRDPQVAAAWAAFRREPTSRAAISELGARLRTQARLDLRTYALSGSADTVGGVVTLGVKLGGEVGRASEHARLLSAATRPPGGLWERRRDCVRA